MYLTSEKLPKDLDSHTCDIHDIITAAVCLTATKARGQSIVCIHCCTHLVVDELSHFFVHLHD